MADRHLNTTGSGTAGGTTWATAFTSWSAAVAAMSAGDVLYVDSAFNTAVTGINLTFPGTPANPNRILSGTPDTISGITALVAGADCASNNTTFSVVGSFYAYGIDFLSSSGSSHALSIGAGNGNVVVLDNCTIQHTGAGGGSTISLGTTSGNAGTHITLVDTGFKFGAAGQIVSLNSMIVMQGGSVLAGGTSPTTVFSPAGGQRACSVDSIGFDFSNCSSTVNLTSVTLDGGSDILFADFRVPASWSGVPVTGTTRAGMRAEFYAGDNSTGVHRYWIYDYPATEQESSSIYLTGTTVDGASISGKITCSANVAYPQCYKSKWIYAYDAGAGSARTATVQCARDGSATVYDNDEVWLEVECLGNASYPLGVFSDDAPADVLTAPAAQTSSSASWTGLSGTNCKFELSVSYTPRLPGYVRARVCAAIPSSGVVYYDPVLTLS